jgi:hypothetical protein
LRAAGGIKVDQLLRQLEALKPLQRTYERPQAAAAGRIIRNPAPWVRRQMAISGVI